MLRSNRTAPHPHAAPVPATQSTTTAGFGARAWPVTAVAAGILGLIATFVTDLHVEPADGSPTTAAIVEQVSYRTAHISIVAGYLAVGFLLLLAAAWHRHVLSGQLESIAARLVPLGLTASAAALTLGYGWKGALATYLPGAPEADAFDNQGVYVYYMLNDFGSFIGWLGVVVAAAGVAWMGLRERSLPLWLGLISVPPPVGVVALVGAIGLPGAPGLFAAIWLVIAGTGLALRNPFVRTGIGIR
ncbi:MAG: hypothetical protein QM589_09910 [Thermomicrobiales bacterium]